MPSTQAGIQLEKLVTVRLGLLDREIKVLFHFQVSREAFGTHSVQESEINRFTSDLCASVTCSGGTPKRVDAVSR
jgi:hypothetical protein